MEKGSIVDRGTHAELLERNPLYQKLYNLQFSGENSMAEEAVVA